MSKGIAAGLVAFALASPGPARADDAWSVAEAAAVAESKTSDGATFDRAVEQAFSKDHGATLSKCAKETRKPDLSKFTLLLRVDARGVVEQALVKPATNLAVCLEAKMKGWQIAPPPHDAYWAKLDLDLKPK